MAIRARPIINPAAVDAVRLLLRDAFSRAMCPVTLLLGRCSSGAPRNDADGLENSGANIDTATNTNTAPRPSDMSSTAVPAPPNRPYARKPMPNTDRMMAMIVRRVPSPEPNRNPDRIAATGGTVAARRAGVSDANIVTPIPTIKATMIVRGAMMMSMLGNVRPSQPMTLRRPSANNTPPPSPTTDAITPTINDSSSELNLTWRPLAPSARSRASSRTR